MTTHTLTPDLVADRAALMEHLLRGAPLDPDVARRIHERAAEVTERVRREQGVRDMAVELVRQGRDES